MRHAIPITLSFAAGCSVADPDPELTRFSSCDELSQYMRRMALDEARWDWSSNFDIGGSLMAENSVRSFDAAMEAPMPASSSAENFSKTNLQEQGVDEADLIKTDGSFVYSAAGQYLVISRVWPVEAASERSRVEIDGWIDGLYLVGDRVLVLSTVFGYEGASPRSGSQHQRLEDSTLVTMIDVSDRDSPKVIRETYTSGLLESSRRIGDRLFVVTYTDIAVEGARADSWKEARRRIETAAPVAWLPRKVDHLLRKDGSWESKDESSCDCTDVYASRALGGTFVTNVLSLDLSHSESDFVGEAVVGRADTVYASADALYVAYTESAEGAFATFDGALDTVIHKFTIGEDQDKPRYDASAKIVGILPDQFALSEHQGVLRVATTDTQSWSSNVYTLETMDGEFHRLDVLRGLAPGEQLFSSRFIGDKGYLVTYVVNDNGISLPDIAFGDPLFTLDLSDPLHIEALGELQLDGWSDYIHPLGPDHLLTVGMDSGDDGWQVAVSLFDVSDPRNPKLADRALPGSFSSEANQDHHAFNYFSHLGVLAIPGMDRQDRSGLDLIEASPEGLEVVGKLYQDSALPVDPWCTPVRRSVFLEDQVWALSEAGLTAAYAHAPGEVIASIPFNGIAPTCASAPWF